MLKSSLTTPFGSLIWKPALSLPVRFPNVWALPPQPTALTP